MSTRITVKVTIHAPIEKVWKYWTQPEHIKQWNNASDDWHTPEASNDLKKGGKFVFKMAAKDESFSFDFGGTYKDVIEHQEISYTMDDDRQAEVNFDSTGNETQVTETFDAETVNSIDRQRDGWQAILNNFKKYVENN